MAIRLTDEETEKYVIARGLLTPQALAPFRVQVSVDSAGTLFDLLVSENIITPEMIAELEKSAPSTSEPKPLRSISGRPTSFLNRPAAPAPAPAPTPAAPRLSSDTAHMQRRSTRISFDGPAAPGPARLPAAGSARTAANGSSLALPAAPIAIEPLAAPLALAAHGSARLYAGWPAGVAPADPAAEHIQAMLRLARQHGASDIYLSAGRAPLLRIHGELRPLAAQAPLTAAVAGAYVQQLLTHEQRELFERNGDAEVCYEFPGGGRFRVSAFKHRAGCELAVRVVPQRIASAAELGLPESVTRLAQFSSGLVLAASPRGQGKTATWLALLEIVNRSRHGHIFMIEEPLECALIAQGCEVTQLEIGRHALSIEAAIESALHDDADVVAIGELKTEACVHAAIRACEAGLLVLATVQAADCGRALDRIACTHDDAAHLRNGLAENLRGVVAQQLIPKKDGSGRAAACEVLINSNSVANMIREGKTQNLVNVMQTGRQQGMMMLDDSMKALLDAEVIAIEEALPRSKDKNAFKPYLAPAEAAHVEASAAAAPPKAECGRAQAKPEPVKPPPKPEVGKILPKLWK